MRLKFSVFCFFLLTMMVCYPVIADSPQHPKQSYFVALPDIPLMPMMVEVMEQGFVFDKAEGRVVESVGFLSASSPKKVLHFYQDAFRSLGWKPLNNKAFSRNNEQINLEIEELPQGVQIRFRLSPQPMPMSR